LKQNFTKQTQRCVLQPLVKEGAED